jgi:exosortase
VQIAMNRPEALSQTVKKASILCLAGITLGTFWMYLSLFKWLLLTWQSLYKDTFGYLVPVISVAIVFIKRKKIIAIPPAYTFYGWFFLLPPIGVALYSRLYDCPALACLSLPFYLYGICLLIWGKDRSRYLIFPVFFCLFLYPWDTLIESVVGFHLQHLSTLMAFYGLKALGMNASISGTLIHTGKFLIQVVPECSGLTMLKVLFFFGALGAYLYPGKMPYKWILWVSIIPLAVCLNMCRILSVGIIGHFMNANAAILFFHQVSGLLLFGLAMLFLYGESAFFKRIEGVR